jgi:hypothetical protein
MRLALIGLATAIAALTVGAQSGSAQHVSRYCRASASGLARYCTENPDYIARVAESRSKGPRRNARRRDN